MFRKEFAEIIRSTGMVPAKDLRPLLADTDESVINEFQLLKLSFFDDVRFAKQLVQKYNETNKKDPLSFVELSKAKIKEANIKLVKRSDAIKYRIVPIQRNADAVRVAIYDPTIITYRAEIQTIFQNRVVFVLTNISSWKKIFDSITESVSELLKNIQEVKTEEDDAEGVFSEEDIGDDIIATVNKILAEAFVKEASDIHVEPYQKRFRIRFRIDGILQEISSPKKKLMLPIISRFKIMSSMDISEKKKPQDGRIKMSIGGKEVDYRVSSLPTLYGEKIVLRVLDKSNLQIDMTKLGFEKKQLQDFSDGINNPYGMCLVTGPTGSGKTTTLYSGLAELNKVSCNISTAEDPVEFNFEGINQVNVRAESGVTFAKALKAFLRQDPDIIMVGEIRDKEVGEIAVEAALTGHLVLSTLHTNDASSTITRLLNMGIEPFLVAGSLNVVVAQRLCRKICSNCSEKENVSISHLVSCGIAPESAKKIKIYKGKGCHLCHGTGYKGRIAIYEVLKINPSLKELILRNSSSDSIKKQAIKDGMKTLRMSALTKAVQGLTTLEEAISNSAADKF